MPKDTSTDTTMCQMVEQSTHPTINTFPSGSTTLLAKTRGKAMLPTRRTSGAPKGALTVMMWALLVAVTLSQCGPVVHSQNCRHTVQSRSCIMMISTGVRSWHSLQDQPCTHTLICSYCNKCKHAQLPPTSLKVARANNSIR
jgi:hypothetical protein